MASACATSSASSMREFTRARIGATRCALELLSPFAGAKIVSPALYLAGDQDVVLLFPA